MAFGRKYWLALVLCLALHGSGQVRADLVVLHTNDVHCGVENQLGYAKVAQYKKDLMKNPDDTVQLVDAGDAIQGEPLGSLTRGQAIIDIMNVAGYDFAIPGNHEFDYGMARFLELAPQLNGGYYSCNLIDLRTGKPVFPPYKMVTYDGGKKAAFIGVTTPQTLISSTPRYFQDDKGQFIYGFSEDATGQKLYEQVQKAIDQAWDEGARTIILVTHLGQNGSLPVWTSEALAAHTQKVAAIIGGHSHERYERLVKNRKGQPVLIVQTGTKFQSVGKLVIDDYGHVRGELVTRLDGSDAADGSCRAARDGCRPGTAPAAGHHVTGGFRDRHRGPAARPKRGNELGRFSSRCHPVPDAYGCGAPERRFLSGPAISRHCDL